MTGTYTVVCPFCKARLLNATRSGEFTTIAAATKAAAGHVKYHCERVPVMPQRWREREIAKAITPVEGP